MSFIFTKFSAKAKEFVPTFGMSNKAPEFVPVDFSQTQTAPAANAFFNLDAYSDESSSDDDLHPEKAPIPKARSLGSKSGSEPDTPNAASTGPPDSETASLDSDESDAEQDSDHKETLEADFSISVIMKMRHAVDSSDGVEGRMGAEFIDTPVTPAVERPQSPKSEQGRADRRGEPRGERHGEKRGSAPRTPKNTQRAKKDQVAVEPEKLQASSGEPQMLQASTGDSWMSQQAARRSKVTASPSDEDIVRAIKSNLNKLTIEKFTPIYEKLVSCGIETSLHLEALINEIFEKATTQHHFINMYAELCELLHAHYLQHPTKNVSNDPKLSFKKILLNGCQAFFEKHLKLPTEDLEKLEEADRVALERQYKMQMIGNIKFVGALLVRQMLATKVMFSICEELLTEPTAESLESLAVLLTVVGPRYDIPGWPGHATLIDVFARLRVFTKDTKISSRVRFLLKDVLELRECAWKDSKPKKAEGPSTLKAVADTQAKEEAANGGAPKGAGKGAGKGKSWSSSGGNSSGYQGKSWSSPSGNAGKAAGKGVTYNREATPYQPSTPAEGYKRINSLAGLRKDAEPTRPRSPSFDKDAFQKVVSGVLAELRLSHDLQEAISRISDAAVPESQQFAEVCRMLESMVEEGSVEARKLGFELLAGLFSEGHWKPNALTKGLQIFVEQVCPDLKCDVPALPKILCEELQPVLAPLVHKGLNQSPRGRLMQQAQLDALTSQ